jgi:hypothetical protein
VSSRTTEPHRLRPLLWLALVWVLAALPAAAVDTLALRIAALDGHGWRAEELSVRVAWEGGETPVAQVSAARLVLPEPVGTLEAVELRCPALRLDAAQIACPAGRARVGAAPLDHPGFQLSFAYDRRDGGLELDLRELRMADGTAHLSISATAGGWSARVEASALDAERLPLLLGALWPQGAVAEGRVSLAGTLSGADAALAALDIAAEVHGLAFSDAAGSRAGEGVEAHARVQGKAAAAGWSGEVALTLHAGDVYAEPVFVSAPAEPLEVQAVLDWDRERDRLRVSRLDYAHPGVVRARLTLQARRAEGLQWEALDLRVDEGHLPGLYETYLQPLLVGTALDSLDTDGQVRGALRLEAGALRTAELAVRDLHLEDRKARFSLYGVDGDLAWGDGAEPARSQLSWRSGSVYRMGLGAVGLALEQRDRGLRLLAPFALPVLDGELRVETFELERFGAPDLRWHFDAVLTPLSMEAFTHAMGWPTMAGQLSGVIPAVSYEEGRLEVSGVLLVRVFDGAVTVRNLYLERPFGIVPTLYADVDLANLDLEMLTRTFDFGKIEGRLSGQIHGLYMEDWEPAAFDARFFTPPGDRSRRRISQRAVDNLTRLGGGVGGALSRGFMRFFEEFSYSRIGLSCRLERGVCHMDGIAPAGDGYAIVRGGGLPRIDVIGYAREVDWDELIARLKRVTGETGPVIQ